MKSLRWIAIIVIYSIIPADLRAQTVGAPQRGLGFARAACAGCHAVEREQFLSPDPRAPPFDAIANTRGMTGTALSVFLQTSHSTMPNLILEADEIANVAAYILSLRREQ